MSLTIGNLLAAARFRTSSGQVDNRHVINFGKKLADQLCLTDGELARIFHMDSQFCRAFSVAPDHSIFPKYASSGILHELREFDRKD